MFNFDVKEINSPCNLPWLHKFVLNFFRLFLFTKGKTKVKSLFCNLMNLAICRLLRGVFPQNGYPVFCCFLYVNHSQVEYFATYQVANVFFPQVGNLVICRFLYIDYSQTDSFGTFQSVKAFFFDLLHFSGISPYLFCTTECISNKNCLPSDWESCDLSLTLIYKASFF